MDRLNIYYFSSNKQSQMLNAASAFGSSFAGMFCFNSLNLSEENNKIAWFSQLDELGLKQRVGDVGSLIGGFHFGLLYTI